MTLLRRCFCGNRKINNQTNKQTNMHTLVCSCHCGTVIYFTSPVVVVVPYCQLSWCFRGNLCKSRVQLWHLKTHMAHALATSCEYTHTRTWGKHMVYNFFCIHTTAVPQMTPSARRETFKPTTLAFTLLSIDHGFKNVTCRLQLAIDKLLL